MAEYPAATSVHKTLTGDAVDEVTLASTGSALGNRVPGVLVTNRTVTTPAEIYVTWGTDDQIVADPEVGGDDTIVIPAVTGASKFLPASAGPVVVKLISTADEDYSVEAL